MSLLSAGPGSCSRCCKAVCRVFCCCRFLFTKAAEALSDRKHHRTRYYFTVFLFVLLSFYLNKDVVLTFSSLTPSAPDGTSLLQTPASYLQRAKMQFDRTELEKFLLYGAGKITSSPPLVSRPGAGAAATVAAGSTGSREGRSGADGGPAASGASARTGGTSLPSSSLPSPSPSRGKPFPEQLEPLHHFRLGISGAVYEDAEYLTDYVRSFLRKTEKSTLLVLHVNSRSKYPPMKQKMHTDSAEEVFTNLETFANKHAHTQKRLIVNRKRYSVGYGQCAILRAHVSNIGILLNQTGEDKITHIVLAASNMFLVREHLEDYVFTNHVGLGLVTARIRDGPQSEREGGRYWKQYDQFKCYQRPMAEREGIDLERFDKTKNVPYWNRPCEEKNIASLVTRILGVGSGTQEAAPPKKNYPPVTWFDHHEGQFFPADFFRFLAQPSLRYNEDHAALQPETGNLLCEEYQLSTLFIAAVARVVAMQEKSRRLSSAGGGGASGSSSTTTALRELLKNGSAASSSTKVAIPLSSTTTSTAGRKNTGRNGESGPVSDQRGLASGSSTGGRVDPGEDANEDKKSLERAASSAAWDFYNSAELVEVGKFEVVKTASAADSISDKKNLHYTHPGGPAGSNPSTSLMTVTGVPEICRVKRTRREHNESRYANAYDQTQSGGGSQPEPARQGGLRTAEASPASRLDQRGDGDHATSTICYPVRPPSSKFQIPPTGPNIHVFPGKVSFGLRPLWYDWFLPFQLKGVFEKEHRARQGRKSTRSGSREGRHEQRGRRSAAIEDRDKWQYFLNWRWEFGFHSSGDQTRKSASPALASSASLQTPTSPEKTTSEQERAAGSSAARGEQENKGEIDFSLMHHVVERMLQISQRRSSTSAASENYLSTPQTSKATSLTLHVGLTAFMRRTETAGDVCANYLQQEIKQQEKQQTGVNNVKTTSGILSAGVALSNVTSVVQDSPAADKCWREICTLWKRQQLLFNNFFLKRMIRATWFEPFRKRIANARDFEQVCGLFF
ncbi:unnamed protein product [Amoebophrya sp. A120]|nr:unnamed protein product [Amoebophrya sp. A120]|eukprot:GSA120T00024303001.1